MATLQTTATRPDGDSHADGKAYFETDTNKFIVWDATAGAWIQLDSDGTGAVFESINFATDNDITPGTEQEIAALTGYDIGTYALNSDGSAFYVYDGSDWNIFNSYN